MPRQPGLPHNPAQFASFEGAHGVLMQQFGGVHREGRFRGEGDEIGGGPDRDAALCRESREVCGAGGHPSQHAFKGHTAPGGLRPDDGESRLQARDAAPGEAEVAPEGLCSFLCESHNDVALSEVMLKMLQLPVDSRRAMGLAGREHVIQRYDMDCVLDEWLAIFAGLADQHMPQRQVAKSAV